MYYNTNLAVIEMVSARHPNAIYVGNGQSGGSFIGTPWRIVLHTTETSGMPDYSQGASAPHVTYDPGSGLFIQHTEFTTAARALANPAGGVQTNRANALQVEIICYSDKSIADQKPYRQWVGDLTDGQYRELGEFLRWLCVDAGVSNSVRLPRPTPRYGVDSPARMSGTDWNAFHGICGHFEVPENSHWDTGALDIVRLTNIIGEEDEEVLVEELIIEIQEAINRTGVTPPLALTGRWDVPTANRFVSAMMTGPAAGGGVTEERVKELINNAKIQAS